jgi:hypothetical protein
MQNAAPALRILRNDAEQSLESRVRGNRACTVWEGGDEKGPKGTSSAPHFIGKPWRPGCMPTGIS